MFHISATVCCGCVDHKDPPDVDYLMDFQQLLPGHSLHSQKRAAPRLSWTLDRFCVYARMHTGARLRQEGWKAKQETAIMRDERGESLITSLRVRECVSASVRVKKRRCRIISAVSAAVACMYYTARKPQRWYHTHTHTHSQNVLSFKFLRNLKRTFSSCL